MKATRRPIETGDINKKQGLQTAPVPDESSPAEGVFLTSRLRSDDFGTIGRLSVTGNSVLDFGASTASTLNSTSLSLNGGVTLSVNNWTNLTDYFYAQNFVVATPNTRRRRR